YQTSIQSELATE
ncbi:unnamed protein product, partial [Rotaria sp. Silwood1]